MDKLICVGKNYLEHAKELGDAVPEMPVLFLKPPSCLATLVQSGDLISLPFPAGRGSLHHECEIVVRISRDGSNLSLGDAEKSFDALSLGLDMTLRDLQNTLKKNGHPWEVSKVFPGAAAIGNWVPLSSFPDYETTEFSFSLGDAVKQKGTAKQMRLSIAECIAYASKNFELKTGDLLFTGTPAGVGPIEPGTRGRLSFGNHVNYQVQW